MGEMTTVNSIFGNVEDVTHKPKRMQGANFGTVEDKPAENGQESDIPQYLTLEKVINYCEGKANSTTPEGRLNLSIAEWLRELLHFRANALRKSSKDASPKGDTVVTALIDKERGDSVEQIQT